jgi:glycosyltransferase involved in cell wall biosynthesis
VKRWVNIATYRVIAPFEWYVARVGAARVVAVSKALAAEIFRSYRADPARVRVLPDGVDLHEFSPATPEQRERARAGFGVPGRRPAVLFVGHNWERKGLGVLVRSLTLLPQGTDEARPYLLVAGGSRSEAYEGGVRARLGGDVRFAGIRTDMARLYAAADLCLLPSRQESFGLPILEAMASGLPSVVSRCAGVAEIVTDGIDGVLLDDPESAEELAEKIGRLVRDPDLRRRLGEQARKTAERYSWGEIAERVERIYSEALRRSG